MNKRALLKKGYIVDDRISYDEDGEVVVRNYKVNKNRGGGNSATVIIENAVITTDPVSIKTLSEKIGKSAAEIVKTLFVLSIMKTTSPRRNSLRTNSASNSNTNPMLRSKTRLRRN